MAAARLGVKVPKVRSLCKAGKVPGARRFGNASWRIPETAIADIATKRKAAT